MAIEVGNFCTTSDMENFDQIVAQIQRETNIIQRKLIEGDVFYVSVVVAILVGFLTLVFLTCGRSSRRKGGIIITGLCDSGKTTLFTQLIHGQEVLTFTSISENEGSYTAQEKNKNVKIIDLPGYDRLRTKFLEKYKNATKGVIFLLDGTTVQKDIKDIAEYLFTLLSDSALHQSKTPILVACNKSDQALAKGPRLVQQLLEKEITTVRSTCEANLESTSGSNVKTVRVGDVRRDFKFSDLKQKVEFVECSAKSGSEHLSELKSWISRIV